MTKILSGFLTLCLVAALSAGASANNGNHNGWHGNGMGHRHVCPAGQHWVKGYKNKNGKHVKGYCR
jgi:hypothetical protein